MALKTDRKHIPPLASFKPVCVCWLYHARNSALSVGDRSTSRTIV